MIYECRLCAHFGSLMMSSFSMACPFPTSLSFLALERDQWCFISTRSHNVTPYVESIKLPIGKPPLDNKAVTSPLLIEQKENDNVVCHAFLEPLQFISQDHKHKKGVKRH